MLVTCAHCNTSWVFDALVPAGGIEVQCQYGKCRSPLEERHSCICDACLERDRRAVRRLARKKRERDARNWDPNDQGGGAHIP